MDAERWTRVRALLEEAFAREAADREGFLDSACDGDPELRRDVESLLEAEAAAASEGFLDDAARDAGTVIDAAVEAAAPPFPERIGPYRVEGRLGAGGMGEVLRGYDDRLDRPVALKRVLAGADGSKRARRRLRREARTVASLSHPAIVQVHDWIEDEGYDWLVMELVDGRSLAEELASGPLPPARSVAIARQIAAGLEAAHAAGLVHRDLKPANVMVNAADEVKILDFGIVKRLEDRSAAEAARSQLTAEGHMVGTVGFMSPEQALGQAIDHRSDLFALGTLIYQMVAGTSPFDGRTVTETLSRICAWRQPPLAEARPETPPALSALVDRLLEKEPVGRPQSAREVMLALDRLRADVATATSEAYRLETVAEPAAAAAVLAAAEGGGERRPGIWRRLAAIAAIALALAVVIALAARSGWLARAPADDAAAADAVEGDAYQLFREGSAALERYYRKGNIDLAIERFQRANALEPDYAPAYAGLARAYWRKYRADKDRAWLASAAANADQALALDEQLLSARVSRGLIALADGESEAAARIFDEVLVLDPANADAHRGLGDIHRAAGRSSAAEAAYRKALELRPDDLEIHSTLGVLAFGEGRYADAEAAFGRTIELDPAGSAGYRNLAAVLHMQGRYAEASRQLQQALEIEPDARTYTNLGTLYFFQGLYQQALSALEKALELGANDYQVWSDLGDAYRWVPGHEAEAEEAFDTAIYKLGEELARAPDDPRLRARLAELKAKRGQREPALEELDALDGLEGIDAASFFNAAQAAEIAGDRDRALSFLERALTNGYSPVEIRNDPELLALRKDPRYHRLLAMSAGDQ